MAADTLGRLPRQVDGMAAVHPVLQSDMPAQQLTPVAALIIRGEVAWAKRSLRRPSSRLFALDFRP